MLFRQIGQPCQIHPRQSRSRSSLKGKAPVGFVLASCTQATNMHSNAGARQGHNHFSNLTSSSGTVQPMAAHDFQSSECKFEVCSPTDLHSPGGPRPSKAPEQQRRSRLWCTKRSSVGIPTDSRLWHVEVGRNFQDLGEAASVLVLCLEKTCRSAGG